jgi:hypothetical protein
MLRAFGAYGHQETSISRQVAGRFKLRLSPAPGIRRREHQPFDEPSARRTRRHFDFVHHLHPVLSAAPIRKVQSHELSGFKIGANHRLWHAAPPEPAKQELVLKGQVADPPSRQTDNAEVASLGCRLIRENKLDVVKSARGGSAAGQCEWIARGGDRNEGNPTDLNLSQTGAVHMEETADADPRPLPAVSTLRGNSVEER